MYQVSTVHSKHKQSGGGYFRQGTGARGQEVSLGGSASRIKLVLALLRARRSTLLAHTLTCWPPKPSALLLKAPFTARRLVCFGSWPQTQPPPHTNIFPVDLGLPVEHSPLLYRELLWILALPDAAGNFCNTSHTVGLRLSGPLHACAHSSRTQWRHL